MKPGDSASACVGAGMSGCKKDVKGEDALSHRKPMYAIFPPLAGTELGDTMKPQRFGQLAAAARRALARPCLNAEQPSATPLESKRPAVHFLFPRSNIQRNSTGHRRSIRFRRKANSVKLTWSSAAAHVVHGGARQHVHKGRNSGRLDADGHQEAL